MTEYKKAVFAGGCFWCMVEPFDNREGIKEVISGFTGGHTENPSYKEVVRGNTGHTEAVEIIYDSKKISYKELVEIYWQQTDPTDAGGQFADRGDSYRPVIYYNDEEEHQIAKDSKEKLQTNGPFKKKIVTKIQPINTFYPAEDYHQDFYKKEKSYYQQYKKGSGRADFIRDKWSN
ncbi:MAG: peptide-methionine (S)-S-oxide reductase MsrA [Atopostipes suicloacalis]|nr:peptide-methionine (S)-S-oxide reductase MsrA [Atopostipes suicloacalis]